jgi:hypothetical protein
MGASFVNFSAHTTRAGLMCYHALLKLQLLPLDIHMPHLKE